MDLGWLQRRNVLLVGGGGGDLLTWRQVLADKVPVTTASDPRQALERMAFEKVTVLVCEPLSSARPALDLFAQARRNPSRPIRVVIVHPEQAAEWFAHLDSRRVDEVLVHPCTPATLSEHLIRWLIERRQNRARQKMSKASPRGGVRRLDKVSDGDLDHDVMNAINAGRLATDKLVEAFNENAEDLPANQVEGIAQLLTNVDGSFEYLRSLRKSEMAPRARSDSRTPEKAVNLVSSVLPLIPTGNGVHVTVTSHTNASLRVDRINLSRIMSNLIGNACEAMNHRGKVELTIRDTDEYVLIDIRDEGPGVPTDYMDRLFEVGFTTRANKGGSGRGLGISRELARLEGGDLMLLDQRPGATFRLLLPLARR